MFPGFISLMIILYAAYPPLFTDLAAGVLQDNGVQTAGTFSTVLLLFLYSWPSTCMVAAWVIKQVDASFLKPLAAPMLYLVGYGPLLCAITSAGYVKELRGADMVWEKTEKTGQIGTGELR